MSKYLFILLSLMILSCNQTQLEKDYIKNLEDKNKALEKELQEIKSKSKTASNQGNENKPEISNDYFTIGSIEDEVIEVMGEPTSYLVTAPEARKFLYGISTVYFYQGKVISYDNLGNNLKVRVRK
jgi:hypothetical protein